MLQEHKIPVSLLGQMHYMMNQLWAWRKPARALQIVLLSVPKDTFGGGLRIQTPTLLGTVIYLRALRVLHPSACACRELLFKEWLEKRNMLKSRKLNISSRIGVTCADPQHAVSFSPRWVNSVIKLIKSGLLGSLFQYLHAGF